MSNELTKVAKAYLHQGPLTDRGVSDITRIKPKNIPRSRIKLWFMGYLITNDFEVFQLNAAGEQAASGEEILFSDDFMEAIDKFRRWKRKHQMQGQTLIFNEDDDE